jgi:hypothetical protein
MSFHNENSLSAQAFSVLQPNDKITVDVIETKDWILEAADDSIIAEAVKAGSDWWADPTSVSDLKTRWRRRRIVTGGRYA